MSAVSIFHWAVELGRIDICTETSLLAAQMEMPRLGHFLSSNMSLWVLSEENECANCDGPQHAENQL